MRHEHRSGIIAYPSALEGFYDLRKDGANLGNIHHSVITQQDGWEPELTWTTKEGRKIPMSEVTLQHWSNIYHGAMAVRSDFNANRALSNIRKYYPNQSLLKERKFLFTTQDGYEIYENMTYYDVSKLGNVYTKLNDVNPDCVHFGSFQNAKTYAQVKLDEIIARSREENRVKNTLNLFSVDDIMNELEGFRTEDAQRLRRVFEARRDVKLR